MRLFNLRDLTVVADDYGREWATGDTVYADRKPERYGKIVAFRPSTRPGWDDWFEAQVTWKKGLRQEEWLHVHHLRRFEDLLKEQQEVMDKWTRLRAAASLL